MDGQEPPSRWLCQSQGCTKSFQRKEHLTRHQKSHSSTSPAYVCRICHKEFSRSDGLQRHLGLHGQQYKKPTGRSRRACAACHSSKIKCDGNDLCSRCEKKRIPCVYGLRQESPAIFDRQDEASKGDDMSDGEGSEFSMSENLPGNENSAGTTLQSGRISSPVDTFVSGQSSDAIQKFNPIPASDPSQTPNSLPTMHTSQELHELSVRTTVLNHSLAVEDSNSLGSRSLPSGLINWSNMRIQQDKHEAREASRNPLLPISKLDYLCSLTKETVERYRALYFAHFHYRWPIIHSASYEEDAEAPELLLPSILMIGGWIDGNISSRDWALKVHHNLVEHILPRLCHTNGMDTMTQPLPIVLYQCTLLNIIFVSYSGNHDILAKGLILRNLLATSICEVGILTLGIIYVDDKPGFFLPFHLVKQQQRQRIAVDLFKIDTYLSVIKGQPPLIRPEELHFNIPETIAHWNANGLQMWEIRHPDEPKSRSQRSIIMMLEELALGTIEFSEKESLLEDVQICLWAMQSQISQLSKRAQPTRRNDLSLNLQRESLKRQVDSLKRGLTKLSTRISGPEVFEQADRSLVRYYYGLEDHDKPDWKDIVSQRIHSFIFDTSILHHLMSLQLFTETQTLRMLAKDLALSSNVKEVFGGVYTYPHTQRVSAARAWTQESNSRRALWHATEILLSHKQLTMTPSLANFIPDPISYIALASAALVVWAHCMYGQEICNTISSVSTSMPHEVGMSIELTKLSEVISGSSYDERGKEVWIEGGAYFRASIENVQLCGCNIGIVMKKFRTHIPHDWQAVEEIAPNVLGQAFNE
ncbi:hypothetical protein SBOR_3238 [Sclerotinia borealis F-4128]|uniref:Uncharacterized protein n=1 Tax=Sclerotinia borealis (strain F-4128) TaxID=1432307 RepID=W9CKN6_SCLBF|nr:hypothetical protein SBOR_3238 [Sclerotinia borealis F-4128]